MMKSTNTLPPGSPISFHWSVDLKALNADSDLELQRKRGELADASEELTTDESLARVDFDLQRRGHPGWNEVHPRFQPVADHVSQEVRAQLYAMHLERRAWLCTSKTLLTGDLGHGWRFVIGPTGTEGLRAELVIPARVVIVREIDTADPALASHEAWWMLRKVAIEARDFGIEPRELLGVDVDTCDEAYAAARVVNEQWKGERLQKRLTANAAARM